MEDPEMCKVIASFRYVKCNFKKLQRAEEYLYESLSPSDSKLFNCKLNYLYQFGLNILKVLSVGDSC